MSDNESLDSYSMFSNTFSYLGLPLSRHMAQVDLVVLGIPYDLGTTGRAGTRHGPQAIRLASANLRWENNRWPWTFNVLEELSAIDYGDLEFKPGESISMIDSVIEHVGEIIGKGKKTLAFGGDHFVTLPILRAVNKIHGAVALIHFDAHTDTYQESSEYDHGNMFYHAPKEGLIDTTHSIQLGIRTEYDKNDHQFEVIDAVNLNELSVEKIIAAIKQRVGSMPAYLTFDIDCLDPAFAPGTGTPVVGGISTVRALQIIRGLQGIHLVGADVVEVAPSYDQAEITSLAAATIGYEIMHLIGLEKIETAK